MPEHTSSLNMSQILNKLKNIIIEWDYICKLWFTQQVRQKG